MDSTIATELQELLPYLSEQERDEIDRLLTTDSFSRRTEYAHGLHILNKDSHIVPLRYNKAQQQFLEHRTGRDLILKARQLGLSTAIQAEYFLDAVSSTMQIATLAHDDVTTQKLRRMAKRFYETLDVPVKPPRGLDNTTTTTYPGTGSEVTIVTAGSGNAGRGGTYNRVHGSEVAFWKDAGSLMAGILQGVPTDGEITLESTPNGAQGWFYEHCMEALDGEGDWALHFLPWWWDDGYALYLDDGESIAYTDEETVLVNKHVLTPEQIKWRRKKVRELTPRLFAQEYPEDPHACFLASGNGYFADIADLNAVFTAQVNAQHISGHRYVAALDFGQANDYSAISVVDVTTLQEVDLWYINRIPWGDIRARVLATCKKWQVETLHPESNSMGGTNIEELRKEFAAAGLRTSIRPVETTAQSKPAMVTAFHWALDEGGLKLLPDQRGRAEIDAFTASQTPSGSWKYEGLPHDDTVIARVLAWHGIASGQVTIGTSTTRWG